MIIDSPIISGSYSASGSLNQFGNVVISGSLTVTGSIIGTASFAETASYLSGYVSPFPFTGSAIISGSLDVTGSLKVTGSITTTGTLTAQTLVVQTVSSSVIYSSGSNVFGNDLANTQRLTGSVSITGSLAVNGSNAILTNQTSSMSASYAVSASYASTSTSASFATTSSNALTASYLSGYVSPFPFTGSAIISGSLTVTGSLNASGSGTMFALNADVLEVTGSVIATSGFTGSLFGTASYWSGSITNALSSSFATTASYWSGSINNVNSASFATSASQALTASYLSGYVSPFPFTGSAIISGSLGVTGSFKVTNLSGSGVRYLVADESGSITAQSASAALKSTQAFTSTAGQTTFSVTNGYSTGYVDVFINGSKLATAEFTDTSGTNIVLATGSFINDTVEVVKYTPAAGVTNNVLRQLTTLTASAGQTVFSASYTPGLLDIFYNGSRLSPSDFTANNGTFFTLATGSAVNDILDVLVYSYQVGAFSGIGGVGTAAQVAYFDTTNSITGSPNFTISGSTMLITGSLTISGSSTFTNIGPAVFSGSLTSTAGFTGSFSGTATSASYAANAELLDGLDSSVFATTGSNTFAGIQTVNSNLIVTGSITAQTLVVQTITSSVDFVTGSTRFGSLSSNTHIITGSMYVSGAFYVTTGSVGIGTTSPSKLLHLYNTAATDVMLVESTQVFSTLAFKSSTNSSTVTIGIDGAGNAAFENKLTTGAMAFVTSGSERMRITSEGYVLIGTSTSTGLGVSRFQLAGTSTTGQILVTNSTGGYHSIYSTSSDVYMGRIDTGSTLYIGTGPLNGASFNNQLSISNSGLVSIASNVEIGNGYLSTSAGSGTAYSSRLSTVYSFPYIDTFLDSIAGTSYQSRLRFRLNTAAGAMEDKLILWYNGAITFSGLAGSGTRTVTVGSDGTLSTSSDSKLKKEDKEYAIGGLKELLQITPRAYKWLDDIEKRGEEATTELGFFADEVAPIIPSAAPKGNDDMYGFNDRALMAVMVKSIQEQQTLITALQEKLQRNNIN